MRASGRIHGATLLSLVVITRNEADRIERCIRSAPMAIEAVVLDCGSTDDTVSRAQSAGARVEQTDWPGFVVQKNRAWAAARQPWVLSLDADECLSEAAARELTALLADPGDWVGMSFERRTSWLGYPLRYGRWGRDRKVRVGRRDRGRWQGTDPHDHLVLDGPVLHSRATIDHDPYRSIEEHLATVASYATLSGEALARQGIVATPWRVAVRPLFHLVDAIVFRQGWRDGVPGIAVAWVGAAHVALKWASVWARRKR